MLVERAFPTVQDSRIIGTARYVAHPHVLLVATPTFLTTFALIAAHIHTHTRPRTHNTHTHIQAKAIHV